MGERTRTGAVRMALCGAGGGMAGGRAGFRRARLKAVALGTELESRAGPSGAKQVARTGSLGGVAEGRVTAGGGGTGASAL